MADTRTLESFLNDISISIKNKAGINKQIRVEDFSNIILNIKQNNRINGVEKEYSSDYIDKISVGDFISIDKDKIIPYNNINIFGIVTSINKDNNTLKVVSPSQYINE